MLTATYHRGSQLLVYWTADWTKQPTIKHDTCQAEAIAKIIIMEEKLKSKITQKLIFER